MALSPEVFQLFMVESKTDLDMIDDGLAALDTGARRDETLEVMFRGAHTLHGASGAVGAEHLRALAHCVEDVLDLIRCHRTDMDRELAGLLQSAVGVMRRMRESFGIGVDETSREGRELLERLQEVVARTAVVDKT